MSGSDLQHRLDEALSELERLRAENERLRTLLALAQRHEDDPRSEQAGPTRPRASSSTPASADEKVALIATLCSAAATTCTRCAGRAPARARAATRQRPRMAGSKSGPKTYLPMSDEAIERHLRGRESIGVYPLLEDDTCWFLACDFDGSDVAARCARAARGMR